MGKKAKQWKNIGLPSVNDDDSTGDWWDRVWRLKGERQSSSLQTLADEYNEVQEEMDIINARRSELTALKEALDRRILEEIDKSGIEKVTLSGQTFSERIDIETTVTDRIPFLKWIAKNFPEFLTVNAGHIKTLAKTAIDPDAVADIPIAERNNIPEGMPGSNKLPPGVSAATKRTLGRVETKK